MSSRGAVRIEIALLVAAVLGSLMAAAGGGAPGQAPGALAAPGGGPPGSGPTVTTMAASSSTFDVRQLPQVASPGNRDAIEEHHGPRHALQGGTSFAELGSGAGTGFNIPAPATLTSFDGLAYNDSCTGGQCGDGHPPDTNGDVGPTYYIQTINTAIGIYDKATGSRVAAFTFNSFMSQGSFGNLCDTDNYGDPVVLYDTFADRWVITDFAFQVDGSGNVVNPPGSFQCIAVSQSGDPVAGGWNFYSIQLTDGLQDYPKLGIWPDGIYMSANMFDFSASGTFQNARVWAFNKTRMYAGQSAQSVSFDVARVQGQFPFSLLPSNARLQAGTPPAGRSNLFTGVHLYTDRIRVWQFHVDWADTASSTFTGPDDSMTSTTWAVPPSTVPSESGNDLDTLSYRLMAQNQYSNVGGAESLWDSHSVAGSSSSQSAVRWYQVPVTGGTVGSALQASTYNPDANNRFMSSIAVDRLGDMAIGYSVSSGTLFPAIRYAGRLAGDAAGAITQSETSLIDGTGSQTGNCGGTPCERWGDYSAMTLDPNGCTFWYTNEYYADLSLNHRTRIGSFRYPGCTDVVPPTPPPTPSPTIPPTPSPTVPPVTPPPDLTAPVVANPGLSPNPVIPGATVTVTSTATDGISVASAQKQVNGGTWTSMAAVDGAFGEASEDLISTVTAPATAGSYQVCVRATDGSGNTSNGTACSTLTVMSFSLAPSTASASVQQGKPATWTINISRSSFVPSVDMSASGLPAGTTASFSPDPSGGSSSVLTVTTSNCGTVTPRGTYSITVTGVGAGLTRTTTVSLTVSNAPPTISIAPVSTLYGNTKLGSLTMRVKTSWSACDADGLTSYQLQRQVNGGSWSTVALPTATTTSINQSLTRGAIYRFRVRATDKLSAVSTFSYGPSFKPLLTDSASSAIIYSGTWSTATSSSYAKGSSRHASIAGRSASYTFTGSSIAWIAYKSTSRGSAQVYVDGVLRTTISLYSTTTTAQAQVTAFNWATSGVHTIKIVVVGTAGHPRVDVDAFARLLPV